MRINYILEVDGVEWLSDGVTLTDDDPTDSDLKLAKLLVLSRVKGSLDELIDSLNRG